MTDHPDEEQLDKSYAAIDEAARRRRKSSVIETSFIAGAAILVAISTIFSAWNTFELRKINKDAAEIRGILLLGTECVVEQMAEHRSLNALGHRADASHHGYTYPIEPGNEPPVVPGVLENVCKTFLHTTTTSRP